jgi:hypothetical protein
MIRHNPTDKPGKIDGDKKESEILPVRLDKLAGSLYPKYITTVTFLQAPQTDFFLWGEESG